jgi:hypothetical protein
MQGMSDFLTRRIGRAWEPQSCANSVNSHPRILRAPSQALLSADVPLCKLRVAERHLLSDLVRLVRIENPKLPFILEG